MSDNETTKMWHEYGQTRQAKRARNRENAAQILDLNNIEFESKNDGAHLIVESGLGKIDFWPGTGLFIPRSTGKRGRGVGNLVKLVGMDLAKGPDSTVAYVRQETTDDQNTTHTHPDHTYKPDERAVGDNDDTSDPPWD